MTDTTTTSADQPQSFLSKLRERSAIIFTICLALSVASFVEKLHMGLDLINYFWDQLASIQGLHDSIRACASAFHDALEWWRAVLNAAFGFLPYHFPQEWHEPISVMFFGASRVWSRRSKRRPSVRRRNPNYVTDKLAYDRAYLPQLAIDLRNATVYIAVMIVLILVDRFVYAREGLNRDPYYTTAPYAVVVAIFIGLSAYIFLRRDNTEKKYATAKERLERRRAKTPAADPLDH